VWCNCSQTLRDCGWLLEAEQLADAALRAHPDHAAPNKLDINNSGNTRPHFTAQRETKIDQSGSKSFRQ
jgi:hypothetical protein